MLQRELEGTICFEISFYFSKSNSRIVRGPNHGPRVDVVQGAALAGLAAATPITHAPFVARLLASVAMHDLGNGAVIPCRNERQLAQDARQGNNIHDRIGRREVQHLGPDLRGAGPSRFGLSWAEIEEGLDQGALTCKY